MCSPVIDFCCLESPDKYDRTSQTIWDTFGYVMLHKNNTRFLGHLQQNAYAHFPNLGGYKIAFRLQLAALRDLKCPVLITKHCYVNVRPWAYPSNTENRF